MLANVKQCLYNRKHLIQMAIDKQRQAAQNSCQMKDMQVGIRVPSELRDAWVAAATSDGRSLSSWIIARCNGLPTTAPQLPAEPAPAKPKAQRKR